MYGYGYGDWTQNQKLTKRDLPSQNVLRVQSVKQRFMPFSYFSSDKQSRGKQDSEEYLHLL